MARTIDIKEKDNEILGLTFEYELQYMSKAGRKYIIILLN